MSTPAAERGSTTVAERAVRRIAERAATEALAPGEVHVGRGSAAVRGRRARVGVAVTLPYPTVLDEAGERVRSYVADRTAGLTGLAVPSTRVRVRELRVRERSEGAVTPPSAGAKGRAWRPWSQRRVPVAVLAFVCAALCGLLLYDVVSVHAADRSPARWRAHLMDWLVTRGPDRGAWPGAAMAAALFLLGVVLLVLAVTPGRRRLLPMARPDADVRAVLDRRAVAFLLRDAVAETPGVTRVRVGVGRRRARVRAGLGFGPPGPARRAVAEAAEEALAACDLAKPLRLSVRVRTEPAWRAPAPSADKSAIGVAGSTRRGADEPTP
ncbi:DUF6286 domain-containing Asp23/Gls24 family envelope stress response protein [Streptomyces sp. NRRL S-920]|uniref:DUF6286 domain-containing Asp23/Gls24 family envelope stress response protein n=1 Tax=Streptomyces sp. NRRL S-920 TaxID=1463921 RepID=UPI0004C6953A|nr:DUF6286 domain-containing protein [Streptomyces sp. NRRL S-920]